MRSTMVCVLAVVLITAAVAVAWTTGLLTSAEPADAGPPPPAALAEARPTAGQSSGSAQATFGNGCFWCTEAIFQQVKGVRSVVSGYSGGTVKNPAYREVCSGTTGHAEALHLTYDPGVVRYADLLEVFWKTHDPTTLNRQGNDVGTQYRSVIFFHNAEQKDLAEQYKAQLNKAGAFTAPIVTEIVPFAAFYPAEDYHQNFYQEHPNNPYCRVVIAPKLDKFHKVFKR